MPKVYDQQISWQAPATQKMQYDKIQDFITPALQNVTRASQKAQDAIVEMQDRQVADDAEEVAQKQADIINNFDEFSLKDPQGEMVSRAMKEWDKFFASMPPSARRRFEHNNPKAREIFELKTKEAATKRAREYTTAKKKADVPRLAQEIIARGVTPEGIQQLLQQEYDNAGKNMTPEDFLEYQKTLGLAVQQGAIKDSISHGNLARANAFNERPDFTTNLTPEQIATNRIAIQKLMDKGDEDGGSGSGSGGSSASSKGSLYDVFVENTFDTEGSIRAANKVYDAIAGGASIESVVALGGFHKDEDGNLIPNITPDTIIANGKSLAEVYSMRPTQRQKLMDDALKSAALNNTPAMIFAKGQVGDIAAINAEIEKNENFEERQALIEKHDNMVYAAISDGTANVIRRADEKGYNNVMSKAIDAALARSARENQTMKAVADIYGAGRADFGDNMYDDTDVLNVMPLPHTPANEFEASLEDIRWTGKMSKADMVIPQKLDSSIANRRFPFADEYLVLKTAENTGKLPKGFVDFYLGERSDLRNGVTPMCLTDGITVQEYANCLSRKGWDAPYTQDMEFDDNKRTVTTLAASGRILARTGGKSKDADYNEGTYAWALDVVDGLIQNEILKNEVYKKEAGLEGVTLQLINTQARDIRQDLRESGKFDEYIDTSHFPDNGFDSLNPNRKKECAADIKESALYDFINSRIVSLGGKDKSPQAEMLAKYMRGAIKERGVKMKARGNTKTDLKTANPELRGYGMVAEKRTQEIGKSIVNANEEEE